MFSDFTTEPNRARIRAAALDIIDTQLQRLAERGITASVGAELEFYAFAPKGDHKRLVEFLGDKRDGQYDAHHPPYREDAIALGTAPESLVGRFEGKTYQHLAERLKAAFPNLADHHVENCQANFVFAPQEQRNPFQSVPLDEAVQLEIIFSHQQDPDIEKPSCDDFIDVRDIPETIVQAQTLLHKWGPEYGLHFDFSGKPIDDVRNHLNLDRAKGLLTSYYTQDDSMSARIQAARTLDELPVYFHPSLPGNGLHLNLSFWDKTGTNLFHDRRDSSNGVGPHLAKAAYGFLQLASQSILPFAPQPQSWQRLHDMSRSAPAFFSLRGDKHYGSALRHETYAHDLSRLELRLPGSDADPYVTLAAFLAGTVEGLINSPESAKALVANASKDIEPNYQKARERFAKSAGWKRVFGPLHDLLLRSTPGPSPQHIILPHLKEHFLTARSPSRPAPRQPFPAQPANNRLSSSKSPLQTELRDLAQDSMARSASHLQSRGMFPTLGARLGFYVLNQPNSLDEAALDDLMAGPVLDSLRKGVPEVVDLVPRSFYLSSFRLPQSDEDFDHEFSLDGLAGYEAIVSHAPNGQACSPIELCQRLETLRNALHRLGPTFGLHFDFQAAPPHDLAPYVNLLTLKNELMDHDLPARARQDIWNARSLAEMPVCFDRTLPGNAMELHLGLINSAGDNLFHNPDGDYKFNLTPVMWDVVRGICSATKASPLPFLQTEASYQRLFYPHHDGPGQIGFQMDNIRKEGKILRLACERNKDQIRTDSLRLAYNLPGADADPYITIAALLAGAAQEPPPPMPHTDNASPINNGPLPPTFAAARNAFLAPDCRWRDLLGDDFYQGIADLTESTIKRHCHLQTHRPPALKPARMVMKA